MFDDLLPVLPMSCDAPGGVLHISGTSVTELAREWGTPLIAYDEQHVQASARAWTSAFADAPAGATVAYASKAFASVGMLRLLGSAGLGADVASPGELLVALQAGIDPALIVVHGNNKSADDLQLAVDAGAGLIVIDAPSELQLVEQIARAAGVRQRVLVRINPDVDVETHRYISTSHAGSKFGVPGDVATRMLRDAATMDAVEPVGVHVHLGSQLLDAAPWSRVLAWLGAWAAALRAEHGITLTVLDIGGGIGIRYVGTERPPTPKELRAIVDSAIAEHWLPRGLPFPHLIVEPGRSIVGQAAITIYRVGVTKDAGDIRYVNVDGGMSDNPRPTLYQARYRALLAERCHEPASGAWWVAGVHCESGDVLVEDAPLPTPISGDLLVVPATGAYAASMASTFNLYPRCAVVLVSGDGSCRPLLRRETLDDLLLRDADAASAATRPGGTAVVS